MSSDIQANFFTSLSQPIGKTTEAANAAGDVAIQVRDLSKCYHIYHRPQDRLKQSLFPRLQRLIGKPQTQYAREFWALKDVTFDVKKGETLGIIGRNGSGKSTLLQLICGTLMPTRGSIRTNGRVTALLELGAGFNPEFTGRENVYMNGSMLGLSKDEIDARFNQIAAFADIGEFIDQPVKTYSSGMHVRLAFAVVAHVDADILVIDEALAVGDAFFVQKCMRFLRGFMERGTLVFVSHDTSAVVNLCERAIWLDHGVIQLSGTPKDVSEAYLGALYESQQGRSRLASDAGPSPLFREQAQRRDMRLDFINSTPYRNDIELFAFQPDTASFGKGGAIIVSVLLTDVAGNELSWMVGGEDVRLIIRCRANTEILSPIVGFFMKDRLGQHLFGDNTFIKHMNQPLRASSGQIIEAQFRFHMPLLPFGDYSISVAIAEGTQATHVQHHWLHDALTFRVHSSSVCQGLVGIPIDDIKLTVV